METTFRTEVIKSSRELTAREKVQLKDTAGCTSLDLVSKTDPDAVIMVTGYVILGVHIDSEKGEKDYEQLVILSDNGEKYITGSGSFRSSFLGIWEDMQTDPVPWGIKVKRIPSKHFGGDFLKAVLV